MAHETGHAKNVANFQTMTSFVDGYGAVYAPGNASILLAALNAKLTAANSAMDDVTDVLAPYKVEVNERENLYSGLGKLATRVVNSYAASGADKNSIEDAKGFKRKIDGARATALPEDDPATPEDESAGISVSQRSYTQRVEHFDNLIALVKNDPLYAPNETELQVPQLETYSADLKAANTAVLNAFTPLSNARLARNDVLYADETGLVDLAGLVKKYVKSLFGADSAEYEQISGLEFRNIKP